MRAPKRPLIIIIALVLALYFSIDYLDFGLERFSEEGEFDKALDRLMSFVDGFANPDLSAEYLGKAWGYTMETLSIAVLGVSIGAVGGWLLALLASQAVADAPDWGFPSRAAGPGWRFWVTIRRACVELARLILDIFRGVPDFVWAILMIPLMGLGATAGLIGIAISVTGILGKIYSELWDNVNPKRYEMLRGQGLSRLRVLSYGIQPLANRSMLSFTLMRAECALRNSSVIGIAGGGGLGLYIKDEIFNGSNARAATLVLATILMTASVDTISTAIRGMLRADSGAGKARSLSPQFEMRRKWVGVGVVFVLVGLALWKVWPDIALSLSRVGEDVRWSNFKRSFSGLIQPDLSSKIVRPALLSARTPVAIGVISTVAAIALAAIMSRYGSRRFAFSSAAFTGRQATPIQKAWRWLTYSVTRLSALIMRAIPEMIWGLVFLFALGHGAMGAVIALFIHSVGVLFRVYAERIDDIPPKLYERGHLRTLDQTWLYAGASRSFKDWMTYGFFQFESNVRMGLVLGFVGAGGLGHNFDLAWGARWFPAASTFLIVMILLTVIIDRTSRALKISRIAR